MGKELKIWRFAADKLKQNESVMLLVVVESSGSSPGRQGFKMIVSADDLSGSVGGGMMEVRLVEQARFNIHHSKNSSEIIEQVHRKNSPDSSGMICSGRQTVVFYKLDFLHLEIIIEIVKALKHHQSKTLKISNSGFQVSEGELDKLPYSFETQGKSEFLYKEKLGFPNKLCIIGGGHCALALSELMSKMDFYIALFDDRGALNTLDKNTFAHEKNIIESYEKIGEYIEEGNDVYVVVMTLGYKFDEIVIRKLIDKCFKYFGVLGSRTKMKTLLNNLEKEGFPKEKLNQIRTPVGLPINSRTPEEIAVSIAAEIISVKNARE